MAQETQSPPPEEASFDSRILPVLPLREMALFPHAITPLYVTRPRSLAALEEALAKDKYLLLLAQREEDVENPAPEDLYRVGCVAEALQVLRAPDGSAKILVEGKFVATAVDFLNNEAFLQALAARRKMEWRESRHLEALKRALLGQFDVFCRSSDRIPEDIAASVRGNADPVALLNTIATYVPIKLSDKQQILEMQRLEDQYLTLTQLLSQENDLLELENNILGQVKSQIGKSQREYYLQEQLKVIERELGVSEEDLDLTELSERVQEAQMPAEAREKAERELARLQRMPPMSPEAAVSRTYIEWLVEIPWKKATKDRIDLARAQEILDEDHYGLLKVKERIVEYLAVTKLKCDMRGPILCFVGPPGVGKTSLGRSIARCMGRKFVRVSLGGVRDEAEIRGHRRTYVGALPGKLIQGMKKAGTVNPVFLLDEVDKMSSDFRGDPAAALLEALDPEQNRAFNDHYIEVDYDLSRALFITTANTTDGIPLPLQDRMEIIRLPGYTEDEKREIALRFLAPKQLEAHGLSPEDARLDPDAIEEIIRRYTREAGVRSLERQIATICRKIARECVENRKPGAGAAAGAKRRRRAAPAAGSTGEGQSLVDTARVRRLLGPPPFSEPQLERAPEVGLSLGLAWTEVGGEILPVETTVMKGKGALTLTGNLGEVLQESAKAALTFLRAHAAQYAIRESFHRDSDLHVHIAEGAIPKDGPSAGVALAVSMASALSGIPVRQDLAMTGEITLRGKVLRIGGLKEKALAAHRNHLRRILIPAENEPELEEIAKEIRDELEFLPIRRLEEALDLALVRPPAPRPRRAGGNVRAAGQATA